MVRLKGLTGLVDSFQRVGVMPVFFILSPVLADLLLTSK